MMIGSEMSHLKSGCQKIHDYCHVMKHIVDETKKVECYVNNPITQEEVQQMFNKVAAHLVFELSSGNDR